MRVRRRLILAAYFYIVIMSAFNMICVASVPDLINYQGFLTDASGNPVAPPGEYTVEFRIWSDATSTDAATNLIWGRSFSVTVVDGRFNVILSDDGDAIQEPTAVNKLTHAFADAERYIQLTITKTPNGSVSPPISIEPRQRILSAPYALQSKRVGPGAIATDSLQDECVTPEKLQKANLRVGPYVHNVWTVPAGGDFKPVSNCYVDIELTGQRPVLIHFDGVYIETTGDSCASFKIYRDGADINLNYRQFNNLGLAQLPGSILLWFDYFAGDGTSVVPGPHRYQLYVRACSSSSERLQVRGSLVALEL